ncbi:hypothetical protein [Kerstersia similis]|uniref:hypothetical protein n=1 Tax=Kerstersia similis TaxID=206505 RepID=UPI0039EF97F6
MDIILILLVVALVGQLLRARYQRAHIVLLGSHLANLQLERHMETLTQGYARAIHEASEVRQQQILETFAQTERAVAAQAQTLAQSMKQESRLATAMGTFAVCVPYLERLLPGATRDFRALLEIHAAGFRYVVENSAGWEPKQRAYHMSAELYLFQHSCHWFCKSRLVADARLQVRHQVNRQKVLDSVSPVTRSAYLRWLSGGETR